MEWTPPRSALRWSGKGVSAVDRLGVSLPRTLTECFATLDDEQIRMGTTVQQMVLHARSGRCDVKRPS